MLAFENWYDALYGPRTIGFTPTWINRNGGGQEEPPPKEPEREKAKGGSGQSQYGSDRSRGGYEPPTGRSTPMINDPAYWGGVWQPNLSWKDVAKTYGKFLGAGPFIGGLSMALQYMNPVNDPLWQKAAEQYLAEFSPGTTLDQLIEQINTLYKTDPNAKVNATNTIRGTMMGLHPDFSQAYADWTQAGGTPYGFVGEWSGLTGMAQAFPEYDISTTPYVGSTMGRAFFDLFGLQGPPSAGGWYSAAEQRNMAPGEALARAEARTQKSRATRQASREWMEETLAGRTTKTFGEWQSEGRDGGYTGQGYNSQTEQAFGGGSSSSFERSSGGPSYGYESQVKW